MFRMKGITPIISIIVLLLIAVALAGAAWTYISGFTSSYTSKVIDLPPGSSYFDGRNVKIMLRNIGTSAINTSSCTVSGNTVTCGDITITRDNSSNDADIRPSAASISPKGSVTITDYACESGNVKYRISSPSSTYQLDVSADMPCSFPTDPVSWWKFDGNAKDSVGENHGTVYGATWADDAERGKVASFDGVNDYISVSNPMGLNIIGAVTLDAWINTASLYPSNYGFILQGQEADSYFCATDSQIMLSLSIGGVRRAMVSNFVMSTNKWYHAVGTWDGSMMRIYINGIEKNSAGPYTGALSMFPPTGPLYIGMYFGGAYYFNGLIDDAMIFKRALSPEEIKALYNSQKK